MTTNLIDPGPAGWTLHLGDCLEGMSELDDQSVDHVIADPPYFAKTDSGFRSGSAIDEERGFGFAPVDEEMVHKLAARYARITRRWTIIFTDDEGLRIWPIALRSAGLDYIRTGAWVRKGAPQFTGDRPACGWEPICIAHQKGRKRWNGGGKDAVYQVPIVQGPTRCHPTQKPLDLIRALVSDFTEIGDLILDSHAGSGTTGLAAVELGRRFIGFELDPKHHATATERLRNALRQESLFRHPPAQQMRLVP
jgi:DNA modification methylase